MFLERESLRTLMADNKAALVALYLLTLTASSLFKAINPFYNLSFKF
jgi:hypothetical protein